MNDFACGVPGAAVRGRAAAIAPDLELLATALYHDPETKFVEFRTVRRIEALLRRNNLPVEIGTSGIPTAFRARAGSQDGPQVAILAEYDALPGVGHGCGHNIIAAAAVGAFLILADPVLEGELPGGLTLLGTPAEEGGGGKEYLLQAGAFDGFDAVMMVHPSGRDIGSYPTIASRKVVATFTGRAAHAAAHPHRGLNALDGAVGAYQSLAQLRQHILPTDRLHGVFLEAGSAPNVVPDRAALEFSLRAHDVDRISELSDRVEDAFRGAALAAGVEVDVQWDRTPPYLPVRVNSPLGHAYAEALEGLREVKPVSHEVVAGSSDVGNVSQVLPTIQASIRLGAQGIPGHSRELADFTQTPQGARAIHDGAIALAATAARVLSDAELREAAWEDFTRQGPPVRIADVLPLAPWPEFPAWPRDASTFTPAPGSHEHRP